MRGINSGVVGAGAGLALGWMLNYKIKFKKISGLAVVVLGASVGFYIGYRGGKTRLPSSPIEENRTSPEKDNKKIFIDSLSLLWIPLQGGEIQKRRSGLADVLEIGRQLLPDNSRREKGAFGCWHTTHGVWSEMLGGRLNPLKEHSSWRDGYALDDFNVPPTLDKSTGLLVLEGRSIVEDYRREGDINKKFAILVAPMLVSGNHYIVTFYHPIIKKYVIFDNLHSEGRELVFPPLLTGCVKELFPGYNPTLLDVQGSLENNPCLFDLENIDKVLDPKKWEGFNLVIPKWQDNNCYLAVAWFRLAYELKLADLIQESAQEKN